MSQSPLSFPVHQAPAADPAARSGATPDLRDPEQPLRTEHLRNDLAGRSVRGGTITLSGQAIKLALRLIETVILARLLAPEAFGLIAMVTAVMGFGAIFRDAGLSMATIQRNHVTHAQITSLFWINLALSATLAALLAAAAPGLALFYGEPRLVPITMALAIAFLITGSAIQHRAILQRQMRFMTLTCIEVLAMAIGVGGAIAAALLGAGCWALVLLHLLQSLVAAALTAAWCDWIPGLPRRGSGVRSLLAFGGNLSGAQLLNVLRRQSDRIVIGGLWGGSSLGLYARAMTLLYLPIQFLAQPLSTAIVPALSRLQDRPSQYRALYRNVLMTQIGLTMPFAVFLLMAPGLTIRMLLGPQWSEAALILQAGAPAGVAWALQGGIGWALTPLGRADRQLRCVLMRTGGALTGMTIGAIWGPIGIAAGLSIASWLTLLPEYHTAFRGAFIRYGDLTAAAWRPMVSAALAAAVLGGLRMHTLPVEGNAWALGTMYAAIFGVAYLMIMYLLPGGHQWWTDLRRLTQYLNPSRPVPAEYPSPGTS